MRVPRWQNVGFIMAAAVSAPAATAPLVIYDGEPSAPAHIALADGTATLDPAVSPVDPRGSSVVTEITTGQHSGVAALRWDVAWGVNSVSNAAYGGTFDWNWTNFNAASASVRDASGAIAVRMWVRADAPGINSLVMWLTDSAGGVSTHPVLIAGAPAVVSTSPDYPVNATPIAALSVSWEKVLIPMSLFTGQDNTKLWGANFISYSQFSGAGGSTIYFDDVVFTYAPTVVNAVAVGAPVVGNGTVTRSLSVLGDDDDGEPGLTYTWTSSPAGVAFSANNSNAAKASIATFSADGPYTITATITDADGFSVASSNSAVIVGTGTPSPSATSPYVGFPNSSSGHHCGLGGGLGLIAAGAFWLRRRRGP
jgi:MYXO-CTERM domain-containing protein